VAIKDDASSQPAGAFNEPEMAQNKLERKKLHEQMIAAQAVVDRHFPLRLLLHSIAFANREDEIAPQPSATEEQFFRGSP